LSTFVSFAQAQTAKAEKERRNKAAYERSVRAKEHQATSSTKEARLTRWKERWSSLGGRLLNRLSQASVEPLLPGHPTIGRLLPTAPATILVDLPPCDRPPQPYYEIPAVKAIIEDHQASKRRALARNSTPEKPGSSRASSGVTYDALAEACLLDFFGD